jgi:hypothetical protein
MSDSSKLKPHKEFEMKTAAYVLIAALTTVTVAIAYALYTYGMSVVKALPF